MVVEPQSQSDVRERATSRALIVVLAILGPIHVIDFRVHISVVSNRRFAGIGGALVALFGCGHPSPTAPFRPAETWQFTIGTPSQGSLTPAIFDAYIEFPGAVGKGILSVLTYNGITPFDSADAVQRVGAVISGSGYPTAAQNPLGCAVLSFHAIVNAAGDSAVGTLVVQNPSDDPTQPCYATAPIVGVQTFGAAAGARDQGTEGE